MIQIFSLFFLQESNRYLKKGDNNSLVILLFQPNSPATLSSPETLLISNRAHLGVLVSFLDVLGNEFHALKRSSRLAEGLLLLRPLLLALLVLLILALVRGHVVVDVGGRGRGRRVVRVVRVVGVRHPAVDVAATVGWAAHAPGQAVAVVRVSVAEVALVGVPAVQRAPVAAVEGRVPRGHRRVVVTHRLDLFYKEQRGSTTFAESDCWVGYHHLTWHSLSGSRSCTLTQRTQRLLAKTRARLQAGLLSIIGVNNHSPSSHLISFEMWPFGLAMGIVVWWW